MPFESAEVELGPSAQLFLFSDGVFEVEKPGEAMWKFEEFVRFMAGQPAGDGRMDGLLAYARKLGGSETLADDFSVVQVDF